MSRMPANPPIVRRRFFDTRAEMEAFVRKVRESGGIAISEASYGSSSMGGPLGVMGYHIHHVSGRSLINYAKSLTADS